MTTPPARNRRLRCPAAAALGLLAVVTVRKTTRRNRPAPGLGRIGKEDGYTYRYATRHHQP